MLDGQMVKGVFEGQSADAIQYVVLQGRMLQALVWTNQAPAHQCGTLRNFYHANLPTAPTR